MDIRNAGWSSVRLPVDESWLVLVCDVAGDDAGKHFTMFMDVLAPNGQEAKPALKLEKPVPVGTMFVALTLQPMAQHDVPGRYVYTFRLEGAAETEWVVVPLDVRFTD